MIIPMPMHKGAYRVKVVCHLHTLTILRPDESEEKTCNSKHVRQHVYLNDTDGLVVSIVFLIYIMYKMSFGRGQYMRDHRDDSIIVYCKRLRHD